MAELVAVVGSIGEEQAPEWTLDRAVTVAALAEIDERQKHHPKCALCGQRAIRLDTFGLCSKNSEPHEEWRKAGRAEAKAARPATRKRGRR